MAITKVSPDVVNFDSALVVSPTLTIGDATAEDTKIVFDGNAQDYYIGLDDSADDLVIGLGSAVGTTPAIVIDENLNVGIGANAPSDYYADDLVISVPDEGGITIASSATSHRGILAFADATSGDGRYAGYVAYDHDTDGMTLHSGGAGAKRVEIDSVGTLKVGAVVPIPGSGWDANLDAIQVGEASAFRSGDSDYSAATVVSTNIYQTGGGDKLLNGTDFAAQYLQQGGNHYFYGYNNGSADATPAVDANDNANPLIIYKGGGISLSGGSVSSTNNGKAGIFWHGNPANGADYCIRRTNDAWSGSNYAQLLIDWDTGVKIDVGNSAYGKSYLEVNGNVKFTASGQGIDFSATSDGTTATSELLDDYEEGTWTPLLIAGTTNPTGGGALSPYGSYTKVGNRVTVTFYVGRSYTNTPSGQIFVSGLPFVVENVNGNTTYTQASCYNVNFGGGMTMVVPDRNAQTFNMYAVNNSADWTQINWTSHTTSPIYLSGQFSYTV